MKREYDHKLKNNLFADENAKKSLDDKLKLIDAKKKSAEDELVESAEHILFAQTVKNLYGKNRNEIYLAQTNAYRKTLTDEWKTREKAFNERENKNDRQAEEEFAAQKKAYEDGLKAIEKTEKNVSLGYDPGNIVDKLGIDELKNVDAGYTAAVNNFIKNGKDGFEFNKDSTQLAEFKQNVLNKEPLKTEFRKRVLAESGKKGLENDDIMKIYDDIAKPSAQKNMPKAKNEQKQNALI